MTKLLTLALLLGTVPAGALAQTPSGETEVRAFVAAYEKAVGERDTAFLQRVLAADYVLTSASGRQFNRTEVLAYFSRERAHPSYRRLSLVHNNQVIHTLGSTAIISNDYTSETAPLDGLIAEPDTTRGRHTGVFVKRGGRWLVLVEQDTELPHDGTTIERQVRGRSQEFFAVLKRLSDGRSYSDLVAGGDVAAFGGLLADAFSCHCGHLDIPTKAQALDRFQSYLVTLDSIAVLPQSVAAIDNGSAVERGTLRFFGRNRTQPLDVVSQYTLIWVAWGQGWQVVTAHLSSATP